MHEIDFYTKVSSKEVIKYELFSIPDFSFAHAFHLLTTSRRLLSNLPRQMISL